MGIGLDKHCANSYIPHVQHIVYVYIYICIYISIYIYIYIYNSVTSLNRTPLGPKKWFSLERFPD